MLGWKAREDRVVGRGRRATSNTKTGNILVGYDGSTEADVALDWAAKTAALADEVIRAVIVDEGMRQPDTSPESEPEDKIRRQIDAVLTAAGASGTAERYAGSVAPILLEQAIEADLLVVGSRHQGWVALMVLGSVSQHVAAHAPCPVVVVRTPASPDASRIVVGVDGSEESLAALRFACGRAHLTEEPVVALHAWKTGPVQLDHRGQLPGGSPPARWTPRKPWTNTWRAYAPTTRWCRSKRTWHPWTPHWL